MKGIRSSLRGLLMLFLTRDLNLGVRWTDLGAEGRRGFGVDRGRKRKFREEVTARDAIF